ncbi:hypothetical protein QUA54_31495 [Microcoleus sp. MOSTC5]|uniref:hypothetical protein n=1 Tax=Microcoleus sp. MOSTC5 TaxID=3055378 RepID=UPI002FD5A3F6
MPIDNEEQFHAEKSRLLAETAAAEKRTKEAKTQLQELALDTQLRTAYAESGGIGNDADREAYEAIKRHLRDGEKLQFENGQPVFIDDRGVIEFGDDGKPKTVAQKMSELKQHPTFRHFFSSGADQTDSNSQQPETKTYTREDARRGKASINDIASGKASVENSSSKPDFVPHTKKINATKLAKGK